MPVVVKVFLAGFRIDFDVLARGARRSDFAGSSPTGVRSSYKVTIHSQHTLGSRQKTQRERYSFLALATAIA